MVRLVPGVLALIAAAIGADPGAPARTQPPAESDALAAPIALPAPSGAAERQAHVPRLTIARLQYGGGGDWYANPSSLPNLLAAIAERTTLKVDRT